MSFFVRSASVDIEHGRQFLIFGDESDRKGIDAVAGVLLCETFTLEDVAQMTAAVSADYLRATTVRVGKALDAAPVLFIEARPAAARLEFGLRRVKWVVAAPTDKGTGRVQPLVLTAERPFCSLVDDDSLLVR